MMKHAIHVEQNAYGYWDVNGGEDPLPRSFRVRAHAVAFGRAKAFATGSKLFLYDADGAGVRQTRASMTYPLVLA